MELSLWTEVFPEAVVGMLSPWGVLPAESGGTGFLQSSNFLLKPFFSGKCVFVLWKKENQISSEKSCYFQVLFGFFFLKKKVLSAFKFGILP